MDTCRQVAARLVAAGTGILAADESIGTMSARLTGAGVEPTAENRRAYRELLVTTPGLAASVSGVILCDETLHQRVASGATFPSALDALGVLAGIKVDTGGVACPGLPGETITEGLDGLPARLAAYARAGAAFAKWRAVLRVTSSTAALRTNAHALARYAAACQEAGVVPVVEPEVLMDGDHSLQQCAEVTARAHAALLAELAAFAVDPAGMVLKPNMVVEGRDHARRSTAAEVAEATVDVLRPLPSDLAGVAFLSGGQGPERATENLAAIAAHRTPWPCTFSFGRALVDPALAAWAGDPTRVEVGQRALSDRLSATAAALSPAVAA
jgi:fructose-bisphosphate aldolase, class I